MMTSITALAVGVPVIEPSVDDWYTPAVTMDDQLTRIRDLGRRVTDHIKCIRTVEKTAGISEEAKEKAVELFYKSMVVLERRLVRIRDDLRLA